MIASKQNAIFSENSPLKKKKKKKKKKKNAPMPQMARKGPDDYIY